MLIGSQRKGCSNRASVVAKRALLSPFQGETERDSRVVDKTLWTNQYICATLVLPPAPGRREWGEVNTDI